MTSSQLSFDGHEVERVKLPRRLTERQRDLLRFIRERGEIRNRDVARLLWHDRDAMPRHAHGQARDSLLRLERRGLVEHVGYGRWRASAHDESWVEPEHWHMATEEEAERMELLYTRRGMSLRDVALDVGWDAWTVRSVLVDRGVQLRRRGGSKRRIDVESALAASELYGQGLSLDEVGKALNLTRDAIRRRLLLNGTRMRTRSEAAQLGWRDDARSTNGAISRPEGA